ncbi:bifunctional isocitrate dehydrogenase kinase/phosphatase [Saprospiraceae bacterium]|jgi:isocitrate dehydrogenase kinase/phosphatase|nr:bifunctional isocitrate dehydrogenase kinase/phosphatase [Bacteroidota bacterium]MDB4727179.1 bifunctional isocitrate dehydrogenase kinase/phosphatase [Saprospiraceae bacterium]MDF1863415.1 bifunctional isocitrate dehydrogenase kinase/phosphatase [Saprospiraceae bacterium]
MFEKLIPYDVANLILSEYVRYHQRFKRITKRAKIRFEHQDWHGIQEDARMRISLYRDMVGETTEKVLDLLGEKKHDRQIWMRTKHYYLEEVLNFNTRNIAETFYNSVLRHSHKGLSADEELMFVHATGTYREFKSTQPIYYTFYLTNPVKLTIQQLIAFFRYDIPFEDLNRDIEYISDTLEKHLNEKDILFGTIRLEILKSVFYRNKGAYIVGRLWEGEKISPFVIPLLQRDKKIFADTLLLKPNDVGSIFSYHRSHFLVDVDIVSETVDFLRSILPTKYLGELYNSIGFVKHGKTVFYRGFLRHLNATVDQFIMAPGIRGMVMSVFTLPSYNMVFKVIKDKFAPPKNMTQQQVKEKYDLVHRHDRVGRMTDFHLFENLVFDRKRFPDELLEEFKKDFPSKLKITENTIEIAHLYVEKKMIPLNIYLESASIKEAEEAINEYGRAIKQLAAVNIFPGDMLLKNFGVTRLKRVVFYDYDEIGFLTDYNFRIMPEPRDDYEEMSAQPFYHVGENDIFPEEFLQFLIGKKEIREIFKRLHGDLFGVKFWKDMQERQRRKELIDVFPYQKKLRFVEVYGKEK